MIIQFKIQFYYSNIIIKPKNENHDKNETIRYLQYLIIRSLNYSWKHKCFNIEFIKKDNQLYILNIQHDCEINHDKIYIGSDNLYENIKKYITTILNKCIKEYEFID